MADLKEKNNQALEELKRIQQEDKPQESALNLLEPELEAFDASSIFEVDQEQQVEEEHPFRLGKHFKRRASRVKIKKSSFENENIEIEDLPLPGHQLKQEVEASEEEPLQELGAQDLEGLETIQNEVEETEEDIVLEPEISQEEDTPEEIKEDVIQEGDEDEIRVEFFDEEPPIQESGEVIDPKDDLEEREEVLEEEKEDETPEYNDEDLFFEKQNFLLSQYDQEEKYLEHQSQQGYHFVRKEGKHYSFVYGDPKDYYYSINYFVEEPTEEMKNTWKQAGWKLITIMPANKDAGWYILRNEEQPGQYRKVIENEEEKYQFFKKYASSCRSTLFLIFICMACCLVAGFLQFSFQGNLIGIALSGLLFCIAAVAFISYNRMLKEAKRMSSLLKARLRLRAREDSVMGGYEESDEELDSDWNELNQ